MHHLREGQNKPSSLLLVVVGDTLTSFGSRTHSPKGDRCPGKEELELELSALPHLLMKLLKGMLWGGKEVIPDKSSQLQEAIKCRKGGLICGQKETLIVLNKNYNVESLKIFVRI